MSNTTLFVGRDMYRIYYIKNNYMFRHLTMSNFRLRNEKKNVLRSCTRLVWVVYRGEVRGEVGTRSCMCCVGWVVWVHGGSAIICYVLGNMVRSTVSSYVFRNCMYTYT